jgi:hypothetical protein
VAVKRLLTSWVSFYCNFAHKHALTLATFSSVLKSSDYWDSFDRSFAHKHALTLATFSSALTLVTSDYWDSFHCIFVHKRCTHFGNVF